MKTLLTILTACALTTSAFAAPALNSGFDNNAPPYAMPKMDGSNQGMTIDFSNEIAKRLGREIKLVPMGFSALIPALQAGTFDMLSVPLMVTQERSEAFLLTEGIWNADLIFLLPSNAAPMTDYAPLKGKILATNKGTSYEQWARANAGRYGWTVESYGTLSDAAQAVQAGRAAAALVGTTTGQYIAAHNPMLKVSTVQVKTGQFYSYAVPKRDPALRAQLDAAIECIKADGTAAKIYQKWVGVAPAADAIEVTPQPGVGPVGYANYDPTPHKPNCH
jgi:polar amino acid transport system substrate-binding protein